MTAKDLGKRLLAEVEEVRLDEILNTLHLKDDARVDYFGFAHLDGLLQSISEPRTAPVKAQPVIPFIELMSLLPGSGKTHLLYYLAAIAVLPNYLGGKQTAVVMIDTDGKFSVPRFAEVVKHLASITWNANDGSDALDDIVLASLKHVHIFHPQSLVSTIGTLQSLKGYLFNATKHHSFDRSIGFIALDAASAFYWQSRAQNEDFALLATTSSTRPSAQPNGYVQLAANLRACSRIFNTPVIFTTNHHGPLKNSSTFGPEARSFRSSLPSPWQAFPTIRLVVQRCIVRKLPVEISVEEALRECAMRQKVVELGKFVCFVNEWELDEKTLQRFHEKGSGFEFAITGDGVSTHQDLHL